MDDPADPVVALDRAGRRSLRRVGWLELASAVRPLNVVVLDVVAEDAANVALVADQ